MFKLLTEEERDKVSGEYRRRRVVLSLAALAFVLLLGMVELFPSYIFSSLRKVDEEQRASAALQSASSSPQELQAWVQGIDRELAALSPKLDTDRPSIAIEKAIADRPQGIQLSSFRLSKDKDGKASLTVGGTASDRQALLSFEQRLSASGDFSDATLPVSSLAKDSNIPFQMKLSIK